MKEVRGWRVICKLMTREEADKVSHAICEAFHKNPLPDIGRFCGIVCEVTDVENKEYAIYLKVKVKTLDKLHRIELDENRKWVVLVPTIIKEAKPSDLTEVEGLDILTEKEKKALDELLTCPKCGSKMIEIFLKESKCSGRVNIYVKRCKKCGYEEELKEVDWDC